MNGRAPILTSKILNGEPFYFRLNAIFLKSSVSVYDFLMICLFSNRILNLVESGIVKYKTTYELPANQICPLDLNSNERRLKNSDLQMTYVLAGIGIATATFVFGLEVS